MSEHRATINWTRESESFEYSRYNRDHSWQFEGGIEVPASAAPLYLGNAGRVDPEEAYVASIASCHMLTFLAICARKRLTVNAYRDRAIGFMTKNPQGRLAVSLVELRPEISWQDKVPGKDQLKKLHDLSHQECFIANSVRTEIVVRDQ